MLPSPPRHLSILGGMTSIAYLLGCLPLAEDPSPRPSQAPTSCDVFAVRMQHEALYWEIRLLYTPLGAIQPNGRIAPPDAMAPEIARRLGAVQ